MVAGVAVPVNVTVPLSRFVPVIVTVAPMPPLAGAMPVIAGPTMKSVALVAVPPSVVTVITPLRAPAGTTAVIDVVELTVTVSAGIPPKATCVNPMTKFDPVIFTLVPTAPKAGEKLKIVGA